MIIDATFWQIFVPAAAGMVAVVAVVAIGLAILAIASDAKESKEGLDRMLMYRERHKKALSFLDPTPMMPLYVNKTNLDALYMAASKTPLERTVETSTRARNALGATAGHLGLGVFGRKDQEATRSERYVEHIPDSEKLYEVCAWLLRTDGVTLDLESYNPYDTGRLEEVLKPLNLPHRHLLKAAEDLRSSMALQRLVEIRSAAGLLLLKCKGTLMSENDEASLAYMHPINRDLKDLASKAGDEYAVPELIQFLITARGLEPSSRLRLKEPTEIQAKILGQIVGWNQSGTSLLIDTIAIW